MPGCFLFFSMQGRGMSAGLPHGFVVPVAIFLWCKPRKTLEYLDKVAL